MGLIARLKLNDSVLDTGPYAYHGFNTGVTFVAGKVNNAGSFNGDYITLSSILRDLLVGGGKDYSIGFWMYHNTLIPDASYSYLVAHGVINNRLYIRVNPSGVLQVVVGDADDEAASTTTILINGWYHVVVTVDSTGIINLYIDCVLEDTTTTNNFSSSSTTDLLLGSLNTTPVQYMNGLMDDVYIFDHIVTSSERARMFRYKGKYELEVNGVDLDNITDLRIKQSIADYTRSFTSTLGDSSRAKRDSISHDNDVKAYMAGIKVFRGKIEKKKPTRNKLINLGGRDYAARFIDRIISASFSGVLSSSMLTTLLSSFYSGEFTTNNVQVTTILRDRNIAGWYFINFVKDLAKTETWIWYVDVDKDVNFRPEAFISSGRHFSDAAGTAPEDRILDHGFEESSSRIINSVIVVYGPDLDKQVTRNNSVSKAAYLVRQKKEPNRTIDTLEEAIDYGDFLLKKYQNVVTSIPVLIKLDPTLEAGQIALYTVEAANFVAQPYLILELEHSVSPPRTDMKVGLATEQTSEVLQEFIRKMRNVEEQSIDPNPTSSSIVDDIPEEVEITATFSLDKRILSGAVAGTFKAGTMKAGQVNNTAWTSVISDEPASIPNIGITTLISIISQITSPNDYDGDNTRLAVGIGSTPEDFTDTTLDNETVRAETRGGTPASVGTNGIVWRTILGEVELPGLAVLREFGIFNNSVAGDLLARYVHSSPIVKSLGEEYRLVFKIFFNGNLTTIAGETLIRDLIAGFSTDFIDTANAAIEVLGSSNIRKAIEATFPKHPTTTKNSIIYQSIIENPSDYPTGGTITQIDLYNKTSLGVQVVSITVLPITTEVFQDNIFRYIIEFSRG